MVVFEVVDGFLVVACLLHFFVVEVFTSAFIFGVGLVVNVVKLVFVVVTFPPGLKVVIIVDVDVNLPLGVVIVVLLVVVFRI